MNRSAARALHGVAAVDRTGERDEADPRVGDHRADVVVVGVDELEHAVGQAGGVRSLGVAARRQRRLASRP